MKYGSGADFLESPNKCIAFMGMSNVGKTRLAKLLPPQAWFHYSVDYRLATMHLREEMIDIIKIEMMRNDYLARHLRDDAVSVNLNVSFSNLSMISYYLGKLGAVEAGGLDEIEFARRQARHRDAEIAAMRDIDAFIQRARTVYRYPHFLIDASGSLCEIIDVGNPDDPVLQAVTRNGVLIYIAADAEHERHLSAMARNHPKPLYYRPEFVRAAIDDFIRESGIDHAGRIDPDDFVRWVFPRLLDARRPRYEWIARHGYTISAREAATVADEKELLALVASAIDRAERPDATARSGR